MSIRLSWIERWYLGRIWIRSFLFCLIHPREWEGMARHFRRPACFCYQPTVWEIVFTPLPSAEILSIRPRGR